MAVLITVMAFILPPVASLLTGRPSLLVRAAGLGAMMGFVYWRCLIVPTVSREGRLGAREAVRRLRDGAGSYLLLLLFLAVIEIAAYRAMASNLITREEALDQLATWAALAAFSLTIFLFARDRRRFLRLVWAIPVAVGSFLCVNIVLRLAGLRNGGADAQGLNNAAQMLAWFGMNRPRSGFPLGSGINGMGVIAGAGIVIAIASSVHMAKSLKGRVFAILYGLAGIWVILVTDSRMALASAVLAAIVCTVMPYRAFRAMRWVPIVLPVLPIIVLTVGLRMSSSATIAAASRSALDYSTANGRELIWGAAAAQLAHFAPVHLIGYGYLGAQTSGATQQFAQLFSAAFDPTRLTVHNGILQYLLDIGYLGTVAYLAVLAVAFSRLGRLTSAEGMRYGRLLSGLLLYLVLAGTTETCPTPYVRETFFLFVLIATAAIVAPQLESRTPQPPTGPPGSRRQGRLAMNARRAGRTRVLRARPAVVPSVPAVPVATREN